MNLASADINQLIGVAFFFGMAAGLLISYLIVAMVYRFTLSVRVVEAAERVAIQARQMAELQVIEARLADRHSELRDLFDDAKVVRESRAAVSR